MENRRCSVCNTPTGLGCRKCKSARYCSRECQQEDKPIHQVLCQDFEKFITDFPRPTPSHKLCFLFPDNSEKPQLIWLAESTIADDIETILKRPGAEKRSSAGIIITESRFKEQKPSWELSHQLAAYHRDPYLPGDLPNKAIYCAIGLEPGKEWEDHTFEEIVGTCINEFLGPFVVSSSHTDDEGSFRRLDVNMGDFSSFLLKLESM